MRVPDTAKAAARFAGSKPELGDWWREHLAVFKSHLSPSDAAELKRFIVDDLAPLLPENDQTELPAKKEAA